MLLVSFYLRKYYKFEGVTLRYKIFFFLKTLMNNIFSWSFAVVENVGVFFVLFFKIEE